MKNSATVFLKGDPRGLAGEFRLARLFDLARLEIPQHPLLCPPKQGRWALKPKTSFSLASRLRVRKSFSAIPRDPLFPLAGTGRTRHTLQHEDHGRLQWQT